MENLAIVQNNIPNSHQIPEYFSSCYKLSSDQFSFYISFIFSIFQSISAHRQSPQGQKLYSTLNTNISYHQDYFKYLQTLLNLFKSADLNSTVKNLENLIMTEGAISKLAGLAWALVGMISGLNLGSERCLVYSKDSPVYEVLCEKLGVSLAVFTAEEIFYVKPVDGRIMLWIYEENYSNLILIVKEEASNEGFPLVYIESKQKSESFEVAYEDLEAFGPEYNAFEKQVYFTGSHLGDYLALVTAVVNTIKLNENKEYGMMFYSKLNEVMSLVKNTLNERYFQFVLEFFWYFLNNNEVQIEQYIISQKEHLVWVASGFQILGQVYKNKILEFSEFLEFFSNQLDIGIVVYQIQKYMAFNMKNGEKTINLYMAEVGNVYRCLVLKKIEEIRQDCNKIENNSDTTIQVGKELVGDNYNETKIQPLKVFSSEAIETFQILCHNLIKIKKSILSISEIQSIKPQITIFKDYIQEVQILSILNPYQCENARHQGLYYSLKCYHTYCIHCLLIQVSLHSQLNCRNCNAPISEKEKLEIYKKAFKINKIEYKNELKQEPKPHKESEKNIIILKKCYKCQTEVDQSFFTIIQCASNCAVCVNCRLEEEGKCSQCQSIYSDEKKEVLAKLENMRKSERPRKEICDGCKNEFDSKYFLKFCDNCKICVKCSVKADKCPNCFMDIMPSHRICESCSKEFTIKDNIIIPCQYVHLFHERCVSKGGRCYKCTKTKKKNNRKH